MQNKSETHFLKKILNLKNKLNVFSRARSHSLPGLDDGNITPLNFNRIDAEKDLPPLADEFVSTANEKRFDVDTNGSKAYSLRGIIKFKNQIIDIASKAFPADSPVLDEIKNAIHLPELTEVECDRAASQKEINMARKMENIAINYLAKDIKKNRNVSISKARLEAVRNYHKIRLNYLNERPWTTIEKTVVLNNKKYVSQQLPAAEMKNGNHNIFATSYKDNGVICWDTTNITYATNLWNSRFSVKTEDGKEKELFRGIRHGVLSPVGVKDPKVRHNGAMNRAKEVVSAALFSKPDLLERALNGEVVPLRLVSTSLLTPSGLFGKENIMLSDQIQAWQSLVGAGSPVKLNIKDSSGKFYPVKIALDVAPFNFGVDALSLKFGLGLKKSDGYNLPALQKLLGEDLNPGSHPGGWVGEYLLKDKTPENAEKVITLSQQIKEIWQNKSYHSDNGEPYKLAQRVAMLAYEINSVPCWNCKSGKDRTGMLDAEIKREAISYHQGNPLSKPGKSLDYKGKWLFQKVLVNSGNLEVQAQNTGLPGNKVIQDRGIPFLNLSYKKRIGNSQVWLESRGMSQLVVS